MKYLGIDLAWSTGGTGLALVNSTGALVASTRVVTDSEIDAWIANMAGQPLVVAVDAPLIVPNESGARAGEREVGRAFSRFGAAPYSSSRAMLGEVPTRALRLAERHDWQVDPNAQIGVGSTVCIEVYPHPALVSLFELPYRLAYKKGGREERRAGLEQLVALLESVPELRLAETWRWPEIRRIVEDPAPGELGQLEDELDAVICAHLAWRWHQRRNSLQVYGSLEEGYIVAPPPPSHPAARSGREESAAPSAALFVVGRLPESDDETWRASVRDAFAAANGIDAARLAVDLDFRPAADQAPDLGPLVSAVLDALNAALAEDGSSARVVEVTAAVRRFGADDAEPGVRIRVTPSEDVGGP